MSVKACVCVRLSVIFSSSLPLLCPVFCGSPVSSGWQGPSRLKIMPFSKGKTGSQAPESAPRNGRDLSRPVQRDHENGQEIFAEKL